MKHNRLNLFFALATTTFLIGCTSSDQSTDTTLETATKTNAPARAEINNSGSSGDTLDPVDNSKTLMENDLGRNQNIAALAQSNANLSTFFRLIRAADLITVLETPGTYTVFAPTDDAFAALPAGTVENLLRPENKTELRRILEYHVVPDNRVMEAEFRSGQTLETVQGNSLKINLQGSTVMADNAKVITPNIIASNGVLHIIDKVLTKEQ